MARRTARTDFTETDDENLVKYIAHVRPKVAGRLGNNLYILLEQSGDQRPWAKRHPWQSWRDRYKKHQNWFDHKIRKYQKEPRAEVEVQPQPARVQVTQTKPPEHVSSKNDDHSSSSSTESEDEESEEDTVNQTKDQEELYTELFGNSQFSEDSGGETSELHKKSPTPSSNVKQENIYPSVENIPQPTTVDKPAQSSQHIREKPKRKVLPRDDDNNFFGTPSPSPSPPPPAANSIAKSQPPTLLEGPYRNSLKRIRATPGKGTNDEPWPPKRRKQETEEINRDVEPSSVANARGKVETKRADSATPSTTGSTNGMVRRRPPAQVNPVASSSKVLLPDPPHRHMSHTKPTNALRMIYAKGAPSSDTSHKLPNGFIQTTANSVPRSVPTDATPKVMKDEESSLVINERTHPTTSTNGTRIFTVDADDPFVANKLLGSTTPPVGNFVLDKPPRIDLRQSLNLATRKSNISSHASTSSTSRHSITPSLLPEDQEIVNRVGLSEVMTIIAKHYGFDVDVAMNTFFATKSIKKTKSMLQYAKDVTNSAMSALLASQGNDVDSCSDEEPQSVRRGLSASDEKTRDQKAKQSSGSRKAKRTSLKFKPQIFDEESEQIALSDYSPPSTSRAGQFMRLVKQGRRKEAVDRERRRASGCFVAQTQTESYEDQPSSHLSNSSPTPNPVQQQQQPMDVDTGDEVDFQPPVVAVAPHGDTVQNQPQDALVDHDHRIFLKRISDGQSTLNEDEDDPAMVKLAQEHRDLVMNVTEENADALRGFEERNNPDLLRLWSLDWMRQRIAEM